MFDFMVSVLLFVGSSFLFVSAVGVVRMPDLLIRLHSATKGVTLGVSCMLLAVCLHFFQVGVTARAMLIMCFVVITTPISGHIIARAAYCMGIELWKGTLRDELSEAMQAQQNTGSRSENESCGSPEPEDEPGDV